MKKIIYLLFCLYSIIILNFCNPAPEIKETVSTFIDATINPIQEYIDDIDPIIIDIDEGVFKIIPIASYSISAEVICAKSYSSGWQGEIAPVDLALAWGELTEPDILNLIEFSQQNRWYYYKYQRSFPKSKQFIIEQSANTHMIPSTENIKRALKHVEIGDKIKIVGFLVKITGKKGDRKFWWNSSLSRKDSGNNSCELLYVLELRVNNNIY